jgi:uncharacterized protein (DUF2252 family)
MVVAGHDTGGTMATPLPDAEYLPEVPVPERIARGEAAAREVPQELHASWEVSEGREDPVAILERQAAERIPELVPIRHARMAASPFAHFRGAAAVMAADLAATPTSGLEAQLCGDAHLLNFGIFSTPERDLVFGLNDFDETLPGPIEWDVKRLAASVEIAARDLGFTDRQRKTAVTATARAYREAMGEFADEGELDLWYQRLPSKALQQRLSAAAKGAGKEVDRKVRKALHKDHLHAFDRLIACEDGEGCFISQPPLIVPVEELLDDEQRARYVEVIQEFLRQYRRCLMPHTRTMIERYRFMHIARKVVGVGSVGTRCWVILMLGHDQSDPLLLQLKEAKPSVLEPHGAPTEYECQGRRVVEGQRLMQTSADHLLGWYELEAWDGLEHDFYVRQLWDGKASIDVSRLSPVGLRSYGEACGWTLARGHARSGDRFAMAAYLGESEAFDRAIAEFAGRYADTNADDHARLVSAIAEDRIPAAPEADA